jgi:hypothetical protein
MMFLSKRQSDIVDLTSPRRIRAARLFAILEEGYFLSREDKGTMFLAKEAEYKNLRGVLPEG